MNNNRHQLVFALIANFFAISTAKDSQSALASVFVASSVYLWPDHRPQATSTKDRAIALSLGAIQGGLLRLILTSPELGGLAQNAGVIGLAMVVTLSIKTLLNPESVLTRNPGR